MELACPALYVSSSDKPETDEVSEHTMESSGALLSAKKQANAGKDDGQVL